LNTFSDSNTRDVTEKLIAATHVFQSHAMRVILSVAYSHVIIQQISFETTILFCKGQQQSIKEKLKNIQKTESTAIKQG
jgi:hypothetical protein